MRSRVSRRIDAGRLGAALVRPGIDPRTWVSHAYALGENFVDPLHGVFVDVQLMPTGEQVTARCAPIYAGSGWGLYTPIHVNDELIVGVPSGDCGHGVVVFARPWSAADLPPPDVLNVANVNDFILVVEPNANLRMSVQGAGQVFISTSGGAVNVSTMGGNVVVDSGGGQVQLGNATLAPPNDGVVHGTGIDPFTGATYAALMNTSSIVLAQK